MTFIARAIDRLNGGNLSFGLREAIFLSIAGITIAAVVAYHYAG